MKKFMMTIKRILKGLLPYYIIKEYQDYKNGRQKVQLRTSLSDNQRYPDFCIKASNDLLLFSNFRQSKVYQEILEHVDSRTGQLYLEEIVKVRPDLLARIEDIKDNDRYGNPTLVDYGTIGKICPSTLRYAKVAAELLVYFGSLDGITICEIGIGYGGQCRLINGIAKPIEYALVDIKPALNLAQTYLDGYVLSSKLTYWTMNELAEQKFDLVISNYAFTELRREVQDVYLQKIILQSQCGYITYNEISPEYFRTYTRYELIEIIPKSRIIAEAPLTHSGNCIIVWDNR